MNPIEIIPTIVPSSFDDITQGVARFGSFAPSIQIDAGDGAFVSNTTWMPSKGETFPSRDEIFFEAHLMVHEPRERGLAFIRAGARRIIGHVEAFSTIEGARGALDAWKQSGAEAGLALLIDTPFDAVEPLVPACDVVLLMSIATLGKQGAPFDGRAPLRVREFLSRFPATVIAVDGGVSEANIIELARAGARRFSVGSAITKAPDAAAAYARLKALAESALV